MSFRIRRKSRPQGDVEIYGGPLKQSRFDGGMNIDVPASEINDNEVAYASNVVFREKGFEPTPGSIAFSSVAHPPTISNTLRDYFFFEGNENSVNYRPTIMVDNNLIKKTGEFPDSTAIGNIAGYDYNTAGSDYVPGSGDATTLPYRRGFVVFTKDKISYVENILGAIQLNAPIPVHGISDSSPGTNAFKYRYLVVLSCIGAYDSSGDFASNTGVNSETDRFSISTATSTICELIHESGSNDRRYNAAGTSTVRKNDYGEISVAAAIAAGAGYTISNADLKAIFSTAASVTDNLAARHFTHCSIYRTADFGTAGIALGNTSELYYLVADVRRYDVFAGSTFSDVYDDSTIKNRGVILNTQGFTPIASGSCGEIAGGWLFSCDRTGAGGISYVHYCATVNIANVGYYFRDIQKIKFSQPVTAMRANQEILSVFCNKSTHIVNMTAVESGASKIQYIPFLTYIHAVDRQIGIIDWATLDSIDENSMIAVCSDGSVRKWDTTKWGPDLAYNKVSKEIKKIVPSSRVTYEQGSVAKFWDGAYHIWYSTNTADSATTKHLRLGFGGKAGFGWSYCSGGPQPFFKRGVQVVNSRGFSRLVVIDATTHSIGQFFWIETYNAFTGAYADGSHQAIRELKDLDDYATHSGNEIASFVKFRELIANSETDILIHDETFHRWRPLSEDDGYRTGMTVSMSAYKDGSPTAFETITSQPRTGNLKFTKEVAARRVQLAVSTVVGGWKYAGFENNFRSLDKKNYATEGDNSSSESTTSYPQFQAELAANFNHWATRREYTIDRATGTAMVATGSPVMTTGPDGKTESAYSFGSNYYTVSAANTYAADFSLSFWISLPATNVNFLSIAGTTALTCKFTSNTILSFSGLGTVTVSSVAAGWHHFYIKRVGTTISVYQNNVLKGTITSGTSLGGGNVVIGMVSAAILMADIRIYSDVKTVNGMDYYYNNVISESGDMVMPQV